jgi:hypothetical protein
MSREWREEGLFLVIELPDLDRSGNRLQGRP